MNTNNIYFGKIYEVASIEEAYYRTDINLIYKKEALLILKRDFFGRKYMKDLNDGNKYKIKHPSRIGKLYVSRSCLKSFNEKTHNTKDDLPKSKILSLGNKYINR